MEYIKMIEEITAVLGERLVLACLINELGIETDKLEDIDSTYVYDIQVSKIVSDGIKQIIDIRERALALYKEL